MGEQLVRWDAVSKSVPGHPRLLNGISLAVDRATSTAIVGRSGSGKSTLLSILALIDTWDCGRFTFEGRDVSGLGHRERDRLRGSEIGLVFQRFALLAHLTAVENVMVPLRHRGGTSSSDMRRTAMELLDSVGMADQARQRPRTLSGGEQQRVAIARALVTRPALILADEPTGALDTETSAAVMDLLSAQTGQRDAALVVVTHDLSVARRSGTILRLDSGSLEPERQT
jgi:putative ABC transport system ATP-binding protein